MTGDLFPEVVPTPDENRRYTTRSFMAFIQRVAGVAAWDLDPAADAESHHAPRWFAAPGDVAPGAAGLDGLKQSWLPPEGWKASVMQPWWRIFCNPPFDDLDAWLAAMWFALEAAALCGVCVRAAMVMPGNRTEQPFWQKHVEPFLAGHAQEGRAGYQLVAHSPPGRQSYGYPGNRDGKGSGSTEWPSVVLVWRRVL